MAEQRDFCLSRAPTRIDLGGGWTDVPPFPEREGGFVCNIAITRYAIARLAPGSARHADALIHAALAGSGLSGMEVEVKSDFPISAGLGGSSAACAATLGAIAAWKGERIDRKAVAERGRELEVKELGIPGGRQDHYAATYGGALALTFDADTTVETLDVPSATRRELVERCILVYTGQSRISGETITAVMGAYESGDARVTGSLKRMRELARQMAEALAASRLDDLGAMLREHWEHQRGLHPTIPTPRIDEIVRRASASGALGAKAMGASGGGCVLILCAAGERERVSNAVAGLGELLDFEVDTDGLTILAERDP